MSRLSKAQIKAHEQAVALLAKDRLNDDEREFVLDNWQESARHINSAAGAFFTPSTLAPSVVCYANGAETIIDLCAGIGCLGLWAWWLSGGKARVTCVEINPDYVAVGRKLFPEAEWICGSVEDVRGQWDCAISNPPFGKTAKIAGPRYSGEDDLAVVDIAADLARWGVFILPGMSVPFEFSGKPTYRERPSAKSDRFQTATGIILRCESTDAAFAKDDWRGVSPKVEVCSVDFDEWKADWLAEAMPLLARSAA
jgi:predicted RNA methylase